MKEQRERAVGIQTVDSWADDFARTSLGGNWSSSSGSFTITVSNDATNGSILTLDSNTVSDSCSLVCSRTFAPPVLIAVTLGPAPVHRHADDRLQFIITNGDGTESITQNLWEAVGVEYFGSLTTTTGGTTYDHSTGATTIVAAKDTICILWTDNRVEVGSIADGATWNSSVLDHAIGHHIPNVFDTYKFKIVASNAASTTTHRTYVIERVVIRDLFNQVIPAPGATGLPFWSNLI